MRADRLLSILMLLQARGRLTARALAGELQVSERTIYRDIDALCAAGVPVFAQAGREGGYGLVDSYRTTLTGLNASQVRALFMLSTPPALDQLGLGEELKAAMRKLSAALPDAHKRDAEWVRQHFYFDPTAWHSDASAVPNLQTVHQALCQSRRVYLTYHPLPMLTTEQMVDPYGLVAKAGLWYLVAAANNQYHVHRVSALVSARLSDESFVRPSEFDLGTFWQEWAARHEESFTGFQTLVRVAPGFVPALTYYLGDRVGDLIARAGPPDAEGWLRIVLSFESLHAARDRLLSFGRGVEVLEPWALRQSILDYAEQIASVYSSPTVQRQAKRD